MPRKQDIIWNYFTRTPAGTGYKAKCLTCGIVMQGIPTRMKLHKESHDTEASTSAAPSPDIVEVTESGTPTSKRIRTMDDYTTTTKKQTKDNLDYLVSEHNGEH